VSNQPHQEKYTSNDLGITKEQLREIKKDVGVSRTKIGEEAKRRKP
jgi:hypothetical protein